MDVEKYWERREAAGLDPLIYLDLFTLRGIEAFCSFLAGIAPALRDQTDQSMKWVAYAKALGITEIERTDDGKIDLGIQELTRGQLDGRTLAEFVSYPDIAIKWHAIWVGSTDASGEVYDFRLEIRQGVGSPCQGMLTGRQFGQVLSALAQRDQSTGLPLNMANVWRNPPDVAAGKTEDTANILVYVPDLTHPLFKRDSEAKFTRKDGRAYVRP